eukprot:jgi/Mesvir1/26174/Mv26364-RA.1
MRSPMKMRQLRLQLCQLRQAAATLVVHWWSPSNLPGSMPRHRHRLTLNAPAPPTKQEGLHAPRNRAVGSNLSRSMITTGPTCLRPMLCTASSSGTTPRFTTCASISTTTIASSSRTAADGTTSACCSGALAPNSSTPSSTPFSSALTARSGLHPSPPGPPSVPSSWKPFSSTCPPLLLTSQQWVVRWLLNFLTSPPPPLPFPPPLPTSNPSSSTSTTAFKPPPPPLI